MPRTNNPKRTEHARHLTAEFPWLKHTEALRIADQMHAHPDAPAPVRKQRVAATFVVADESPTALSALPVPAPRARLRAPQIDLRGVVEGAEETYWAMSAAERFVRYQVWALTPDPERDLHVTWSRHLAPHPQTGQPWADGSGVYGEGIGEVSLNDQQRLQFWAERQGWVSHLFDDHIKFAHRAAEAYSIRGAGVPATELARWGMTEQGGAIDARLTRVDDPDDWEGSIEHYNLGPCVAHHTTLELFDPTAPMVDRTWAIVGNATLVQNAYMRALAGLDVPDHTERLTPQETHGGDLTDQDWADREREDEWGDDQPEG